MADFLLGIDYGTGGAKSLYYQRAGRKGFAFGRVSDSARASGLVGTRRRKLLAVACRLIKQVIAEARIRPEEIRGIAASSALPSLVLVDERHQPVQRAYNLMDKRAVKEVEWLKEHIGEARLFPISVPPGRSPHTRQRALGKTQPSRCFSADCKSSHH